MLMRFDPFRELDRLTSEYLGGEPHRTPTAMAMDARRSGDRFIVDFDLPGVDPASIDVTVERNALTVKAERSLSRNEGDEIVIAERPQGSFTRQLFLGDSLDVNRLEATYEDGVLHLVIPVAETAKPRRIEVSKGGSEHKRVIDTSSAQEPVSAN